jgi:serine/threonine-protein kinase RsbT
MNQTGQNINKRIIIHSDLDIIIARLRAREVARELGFGTIDQARISLAAGELARVLVSSMDPQGEIVISGINTDDHLGIQVVAISPSRKTSEAVTPESEAKNDPMQAISRVSSLVDEHIIENREDQMTSVTLMKWLP